MFKLLIRAIFVSSFIFSTAAYAEILKGEISQTSKDGSSFNLAFEDAAKQKQELQIWVSTETKFLGLSTLGEIVKGDEVKVTAQQNTANANRWEADVVELSKVVIRDPGPDVSASKEIVEEKVDRAESAQNSNRGLEIADLKNKFKALDVEIENFKSKAAKNPFSLEEKKDVLLGDLAKKKLMAQAKLDEFQMTAEENRQEVLKSAYLMMTDLEESLMRAKSELLKRTS
jgi:hypothetical protein